MTNLLSGISRREKRALALLLALVLAGHLLRALASVPGAPPIASQLFNPATDGDPLAHRDSIRQHVRPLGANERIDVDRAGAAELTHLPGIGPALAARLVADRESHGAFGGIAGLRRVRGMGPTVVATLAPHLSFSGIPAETQGKR